MKRKPTVAELLARKAKQAMSKADDNRHAVDHEPPPDNLPDESPPMEAWIEPAAPEAFYGLAGDIVRTIEPHTEADPVGLLLQALVMFGNVIGRGAWLSVESTRHHGNLFAVLVGSTSTGRKGTSGDRARAIVGQAAAEWERDCIKSGLSSSEGLIFNVRDRTMKREQDRKSKEMVEVETDPGVSDKRLLLVESEWASVLKQVERSGNTLSPILRDCWDSKRVLGSLVKNSPHKATDAHISIIGHITPAELRRYLTSTEVANGFCNRHLFALVRRSKLLPRGSHIPDKAVHELQARVGSAYEFAGQVGAVGMSAAAWSLWDDLYKVLTAERPGLMGEITSRGAPQVRRLAMLYALLDECSAVDLPHLQAAAALWDYCERSVGWLFGDTTGDHVADEIAGMLRRAGNAGMSRSDISGYFGRNQSSDRIGRALALLESQDRARMQKLTTGGRSAERWYHCHRGTKETRETK